MKIVIIQPFVDSEEKTRQLEDEAAQYVKRLGYEPISFTLDELAGMTFNGVALKDVIMDRCASDVSGFNANVFVIGLTAMLASVAGTACFWEGWRDSPYCQDIYNFAFRYGLNIILKPLEA